MQRIPRPDIVETLPKIDKNAARLDVLIARAAPMAVVLRRGPVTHTRMLIWNLKDDTLEGGQWVRHKIYSRRCDLSADGRRFSYFAAKFKGPLYSWTAISRPPYFTALALWEGIGAWGGGALLDEGAVRLNHRGGFEAPKDSAIPRQVKVLPLNERAGAGEDDPFHMIRLMRDGWNYGERPQASWQPYGSRVSLVFDPPRLRTKPLHLALSGRKAAAKDGMLRVFTHARFEKDGRSYVETADALDKNGELILDLGRVEWADLDHNGDVLYAMEGCLYRIPRTKDAARFGEPKRVADLNDMKFEAVRAPERARHW
ncbi:MAG: hypothetical protein AB7T08_05925 [Hyphomonadaceae bacterium]